jgi:hypothetical protein
MTAADSSADGGGGTRPHLRHQREHSSCTTASNAAFHGRHGIRERTLISRVRDGDGRATVGGSCGIAAVLASNSVVRAAHGDSGESTFGACVGAVPSRMGGENCDGGGGRSGRRLTREGLAGLPGVPAMAEDEGSRTPAPALLLGVLGDVGNRRTGLPARGAAEGLREVGD